jgi:2-keto-4-pentenoate hydratase/2-oxohepta-3-ene-1,7-dioic acid hydratase in catechol pathway
MTGKEPVSGFAGLFAATARSYDRPDVRDGRRIEPFRKNKGFDIGMTVKVNGRQISSGNWSTIDWTFADVITYTSRETRLSPGDVLGSGTVGLGCLFEHYQSNRPSSSGGSSRAT